ncbi:MAG: hypothetical protein AB9M60_12160 [Leptothrix sp. (in: b-proteobacteria)]
MLQRTKKNGQTTPIPAIDPQPFIETFRYQLHLTIGWVQIKTGEIERCCGADKNAGA